MAQHTRKSLQPDLTCGVLDAFFVQQGIEPSQGPAGLGRTAIAVVGIVKGKPGASVDGQIGAAQTRLQAAHGQHQKSGRVDERVVGRAVARVAHLAPANECGG
jgi:hypothetical protein